MTLPVGLEGGKREVEEGTHEVVAVSTAEIEYCGSDRDTQFLLKVFTYRAIYISHLIGIFTLEDGDNQLFWYSVFVQGSLIFTTSNY